MSASDSVPISDSTILIFVGFSLILFITPVVKWVYTKMKLEYASPLPSRHVFL